MTGWLIYRILRNQRLASDRAMKFASIWLLNPMVANISTRGSSEGLLAVIVIALLWATLQQHIALAGALLGLGVHFKIYPFIYAASIFWWLDDVKASDGLARFFTRKRVTLAFTSFVTFMALNLAMFAMYVLFQWRLVDIWTEATVGTANRSLSIATPITSLVSTTATISLYTTPFFT